MSVSDTVEVRTERPAPHLSGVCCIPQLRRTESGHVSARYNLGVVHAFDEKDYQSVISVWEELPRLSPSHP